MTAISPNLTAIPLMRAQKDLLLDLVRAVVTVGPERREPFTTVAVATSDKLWLQHPAIADEHEGVLLGDLRALAGEQLIDVEMQEGGRLRFSVTPKGVLVADALASLRASGGKEPQWLPAGVALGVTPTADSQRPGRQEWGTRWVAVDEYPIAKRGQGRVWRVWDRQDEQLEPWRRKRFALKEIKIESPASSTKFKRFVREIEQTRKLSTTHEGIVAVVDYWMPAKGETGRPYYVMPLAESSLERAKDLAGRLEPVLEIGVAVADSLAAAHAADVVHRDVKPGNILLFGDDRRPALADFGICFLSEEDRLTGDDAETVGSKDFVSPELLGGGQAESVGPAADVYSLGKTLYAAVAGGEVFPRERHRESRWELASRRGDPRLAHLHGLLDRMVAERPEDRFASMTECREQLARALMNVRTGIPYTPGMYGGGDTPVERAERLTASLGSPASLARADSIQSAVDDAAIAAREAAGPEKQRGSGYSNDSTAKQAIADAANQLLSVGLPLIIHGETDAFAEWLSVAVEPIHRVGPQYHRSQPRSTLRAAAVLTFHCAAAVAWRRRRWDALKSLLEALNDNPGRFIHLDHLENSAGALYPWLVDQAPTLSVLARLDSATAKNPASPLALVAGLLALQGLRRQPAEHIRLMMNGDNDFRIPAYPAFYGDVVHWVSELAETLLTRPPVERELARVVFDMSPEELRGMCATLKPAIARRVEQLNLELRRDVRWEFSVDPENQWDRWTGVPGYPAS